MSIRPLALVSVSKNTNSISAFETAASSARATGVEIAAKAVAATIAKASLVTFNLFVQFDGDTYQSADSPCRLPAVHAFVVGTDVV